MPAEYNVAQLRLSATSKLAVANDIQAEYKKMKAAGHASMAGAATVVLKR